MLPGILAGRGDGVSRGHESRRLVIAVGGGIAARSRTLAAFPRRSSAGASVRCIPRNCHRYPATRRAASPCSRSSSGRAVVARWRRRSGRRVSTIARISRNRAGVPGAHVIFNSMERVGRTYYFYNIMLPSQASSRPHPRRAAIMDALYARPRRGVMEGCQRSNTRQSAVAVSDQGHVGTTRRAYGMPGVRRGAPRSPALRHLETFFDGSLRRS